MTLTMRFGFLQGSKAKSSRSYWLYCCSYYGKPDGAGIFFQCIKNGIQALILRHDYDQYDYAIRGVEVGVALQAPKDKSQKIAQAFKQLLEEKIGPNSKSSKREPWPMMPPAF